MIVSGQFNITYKPTPEDPYMAEVWARYDTETRTEESIQGHVGVFVDNHALFHVMSNLDSKDNITHEDEPVMCSYQLAKWFVECWYQYLYEDCTLNLYSLNERMDWYYDHAISNIGNGNYWPDITIWYENEQHNLIFQVPMFTRPDGYNFIGSMVSPSTHTMYRVHRNDLIEAIDNFVQAVLVQCEERGFNNTLLHRDYNALLLERDDDLV